MHATILEAIYRNNLPSKVPTDGEISFRELAEQCNMYEQNPRRLLRYALFLHQVFKEPRKGHVAHSLTSYIVMLDTTPRHPYDVPPISDNYSPTRTCHKSAYYIALHYAIA